ncbi:hypothetical protein L7F22_032157 [Adiantum nelumboides]|nr:hypothetical protein [Adiantum nelumboides]
MGAEAFTSVQHSSLVGSRPYAILLAGDATEYVRKVYGGLACLFEKMLSDPGETWHTYHVTDGKFPSDEDIYNYEGFVITGSRHDAHSSEPWVLQLCELIRKLHKQKMKLLGICFGHQVISRALGGKTGRSVNGWEVGLRKISIANALYSKPYALKVPSSLIIIEIHQDQVSELPPKGELPAASEKTSMEMFAVEDHVLCIQGHPEFTEDIVLDILDVGLEKHLLPEEVISQARLSFEEMKADHWAFQQLCKSFLKEMPPRRALPKD